MKFKDFQVTLSDASSALVQITEFEVSYLIYVGDKNLQMDNAYLTI
jgi:hypothetical protein